MYKAFRDIKLPLKDDRFQELLDFICENCGYHDVNDDVVVPCDDCGLFWIEKS